MAYYQRLLRLEGIFPVIIIFITGINVLKTDGSNLSTVSILGLTYVPVLMLLPTPFLVSDRVMLLVDEGLRLVLAL